MPDSPLRILATDLSNHLACPHLTTLELAVKRNLRAAPEYQAPHLTTILELGRRHEAAYLQLLKGQNLSIADLSGVTNKDLALRETQAALEKGVDVVIQAALGNDHWYGRADVLRKVDHPTGAPPSRFGAFSYQPYDCKLARETKAETILQLAAYSDLLQQIQGVPPQNMHVVPAGRNFEPETYPFAEYAAYYRYVKGKLEEVWNTHPTDGLSIGNSPAPDGLTYPEPCAHCDICRWFRECDLRRRADDHLSLVAGISRLQRDQLHTWEIDRMHDLAIMPVPLRQRPKRGSGEGYLRVRDQAALQVESANITPPLRKMLRVLAGAGFCQLPAPSPLDMFLDLEGDPYARDGQGQQYLFGYAALPEDAAASSPLLFAAGQIPQNYFCKWAFTADQEKAAFEWLVDEIIRRLRIDPTMHVYHFGHYEPTQCKCLMGRYATREDEVDRILRAKLFVDLHAVFKQSIRAGVEKYSLKDLEIFPAFKRTMPLDKSRTAMRVVEHQLELGSDGGIPEKFLTAVQSYNEDDCRATAALRDWLEAERAKLAAAGECIPRPTIEDDSPSAKVDERQQRVAALVFQLTVGLPADPADRTAEESARWLLAQLLDLHRRELKVAVWESYRLAELDDEQAMDDRKAISGLQFVERLCVEKKIPTDRYAFPRQEIQIRIDNELHFDRKKFGTVIAIDALKGIVDIKKTKRTAEEHHSILCVGDPIYGTNKQADSLFRLGQWVSANGLDASGPYRAARDLLLRKPPRFSDATTLPLSEKDSLEASRLILRSLDHGVFAIQGPPGSGKTHNAARMIYQLVQAGKKVGICAFTHKVKRKLLDEVVTATAEDDIRGVKCLDRDDDGEPTAEIPVAENDDEAWSALRTGAANVVGGTSWLWSPPQAFELLDYLFIDEAGQMALGDVLCVGHAAKNLVLIGDPQQLERPLKGSHPEGAEKSALQHLLHNEKTIPETLGLLFPHTHRLHPKICEFTSEVFYEGRLTPSQRAKNTSLAGHPWLSAGLWFVPVAHHGNCNSSPEEVETVAKIVDSLFQPNVRWFRSEGNAEPMSWKELRIIAPYNAQVFDLCDRLPQALIGTVDKFQGQEAAVVIYSLTTSTPQDAPRGMEFLYSLNRLNVATSRAKTCAIVVGNPLLFEPECRTPRQIQLANAFCRFSELATHHPIDNNGV